MNWLISFEGIDGSGKTTLVEGLRQNLANSIVTREPRGTKLGLEVWRLVNDKQTVSNIWTQFLLFLASHNEHVKTVIEPNLAQGKIVLVDRYLDSTFVYQGIYGNLGVKKLNDVLHNTVNSPFPHLTFILDIDPAQAQMRLHKRQEDSGEWNEWDALKLEIHQKIREGYLALKEYFPARKIYIINSQQEPKKILQEVLLIIRQQLGIFR